MVSFLMRIMPLSILLILFMIFGINDGLAQPTPNMIRESLVARMRHQEGQVRSGEAYFEIKVPPTQPDMIPIIEEVCELQGKRNQVGRFVTDDALAETLSNRIHWWRSGDKERYDKLPLKVGDKPVEPSRAAFDGQVVRRIDPKADQTVASINSTESGHWKSVNEIHPFSFVYYYQYTPYSEIVEKSPIFEVTNLTVDGDKRLAILVQHPIFDEMRFRLVYDSQWRLFERHLLLKRQKKNFETIEIHHFMDWREFPNPKGEPVSLPSKAQYRYFMGETLNGTLAEYVTFNVTVQKLNLNIDIPDEIFELKFPSNAKIYDGMTGLGWLEPNENVDHLLPEVIKVRRWWYLLFGILGALGLFFAIGYRFGKTATAKRS